jgi:hypothetical protein
MRQRRQLWPNETPVASHTADCDAARGARRSRSIPPQAPSSPRQSQPSPPRSCAAVVVSRSNPGRAGDCARQLATYSANEPPASIHCGRITPSPLPRVDPISDAYKSAATGLGSDPGGARLRRFYGTTDFAGLPGESESCCQKVRASTIPPPALRNACCPTEELLPPRPGPIRPIKGQVVR